jgi:hypothetical protein
VRVVDFALANLNPVVPEVSKLVTGKQIIRLRLGIESEQEIEVEIEKGKLVSSGTATWNFDCTHNNDLVDYFKTMFEGSLSIEVTGLGLFSAVDISQNLR